jgi:dihydroxyacetone kinase-like protein
MVEGYIKAIEYRRQDQQSRVLNYVELPSPKSRIVTGGGSGHKPAFAGYVGRNMVDAVAIGEIFSSPPAQMFYDAFKSADSGKGVACLYGNYAGDNMNVKMAIEMAQDDDIEVKTVVANDDVPSASKDALNKRRGVRREF